MDIEAVDVRQHFRTAESTLEVIDGVDMSVRRGSLVAIVGPSGCGKSSLLRILSGIDKPSSGQVVLSPERNNAKATIEQFPGLLPWRSAFENAHLGTEARVARMRKADPSVTVDCVALHKKLKDDFRLFRLDGFERYYPQHLSGGMRQRVAIIRALQSEPKLLFCDEPFSAVDFVTRLYLVTEFKKMCRQIGCTTIFVTHNIEEAIFLGDSIVVLSKRPCRVLQTIEPRLTVYPEDAVRCRESPEFSVLFNQVWGLLEETSS